MLAINVILGLSFLVFLLPFLGLPQSFDNFLYVISGIVIFVLAFLLRKGLNVQEKTTSNKFGESEFKSESDARNVE